MHKMKAYVRTSPQSMDVELTELDIPEIDEDELLVKVAAFGVGIHDRYFIPSNTNFPYPIGSEASGVIVKKGTLITDFQVGDRVILSSSLLPKGGCWAEYVAVPSKALIPMPDILEFIEGAAIPVAGKTALECMHTLDLKEGNTLFIAGASGAIGTLVIQLAAARGIRVIGSASSRNHEYMRSLGAEKTVDYSSPTWQEDVKALFPDGVDAALAIQPGTAEDSMMVVKDGGRVITVSGDRVQPTRGITVEQFQHQLNLQEALGSLVNDIASGKVRLVIEHVYAFTQALRALEKTETRHARGKLVVSMQKD
ncbi:NADP-dependent oxidoreductase [Paraliobacillus salinarum]|uniref:NADP-dependent oxidoreductase n=1 Tax=Paraliobacillus salinarum TaxID=1158996 RepID=UPI001C70E429|nr:NADP-dependent oxidoreductase [Paraliobacillus salinarum]